MPLNLHPSDDLLKPSEDMGFSLDLRKISSKRQSSSKTTKECSVLPLSNPSPKDPDKLKSKTGAGPPCSDPCHKARQGADGKIHNGESVKRSAIQRDELVKHMSNLPGYLQRTHRGESFQEKAFNVGVLDWSRLEKWKHKQQHIPVLASNFTSFSSNESSSRAATKSSTIASGNKKIDDRKGLLSSSIKASCKEGLPESSKLSSQNVKRFQYSETETKSIGDEKREATWTFESFGKTQSNTSLERAKRNDYDKITSQVRNFESKSRHHGVKLVASENANGRDDEATKRMEGLQEYSLKKKERNHKSISDKGIPSVKPRTIGESLGSKKKMSSSGTEAKKKMDHCPESDFDVGHKQCQPRNIVLLRPQQVPQSSSPEDSHLSQLRTSSDEYFSESSQSSLPYVSFPDEVYTEDVCSEIPHSSVLRSGLELAPPSDTMRDRVDNDLDIDRSSVASKTPACSSKMSGLQSEDTCTEKLDIKLRNQCAFIDTKESLSQETAELTAQRDRNPSSSRRFSFSLNRIGRSFSFKEGSTLPQFSSVYVSAKSGPVTSESSACLDNSSKDKAKFHSRTRSSPLRRLLDPILKHKASNTHHSAESSQTQTPKGSMNSISFTTISVNESLHAGRNKGSSIQALLQLTIKNGLPSFKFVLNNERKIFVATIKSLPLPEKDDLGSYFTFYLVNEIKKKSGGWISHGSKEKSCGYVYNIVGQMKFSVSKVTEPSNQNSERQRMVTEYVLLGAEIGQTGQEPPKFIQSRELAAVVVEFPCENSSHEGLRSNNNLLKKGCLKKCLADERCFCSSGENDFSGSTTVILPGGVHGSPKKGEPSPLIYRWKSGGSCDCGGWDVGCKLLVLSNRCSKSYPETLQLFVQEEAEPSTPLFTLAPLKDGFYSAEFNSTINSLQAFFISVVILSCQKLPSSLEMSDMHDEINKDLSSKNKNILLGKAPINYNPIPPLSPFGRV